MALLESVFDIVVAAICWAAAFAAYTYGILAAYFWIFELRYGGGQDGAGVEAASAFGLVFTVLAAWVVGGIAAIVWVTRKSHGSSVQAPIT